MIEFLLALVALAFAAFTLCYGHGYAWLRGLLITGLILCSLYIWVAIDKYLGLPKENTSIPTEFVVHGFMPAENEGYIYLYFTDPELQPPPRSSKVPYSQPLHKVLQQGREDHKGKPFMVKIQQGEQGEEGDGAPGEGDEQRERGEMASLSTLSETDISLENIPPPILPRK